MIRRPVLALLCLLVLAACVAGCGGGGGSGASTATSRPATPGSTGAATLAAERRAAGRAAPFVRAGADNSVPTFGSEAPAAERRAAETALSAYLRARAGGDWPTACRYLAASTRKGFEKLGKSGAGCAAVLAALAKGADRSDPLVGGLLSLRVSGADGFALFLGPHRRQYIVPLRHEAGGWRLTAPAPIPYPPGSSG